METNTEATDRIARELREDKKNTERKKSVMDWFFSISGLPMSDEDYKLYMEEWAKRETYNLKTFIRDKELLKELRNHELAKLEWGKTEQELRWHEIEIQRINNLLELNIKKSEEDKIIRT